MNYLQQAELARSDNFRVRVQQAIIHEAILIGAEIASNKKLVDEQRLSLARQVLADPDNWARKFAFGIASIVNEDNDAAVMLAVEGIWNAYAGVNPNLVENNPGYVPEEEIELPWYKKLFGKGG